jgi:Domain of unknown function (DUF4129)
LPVTTRSGPGLRSEAKRLLEERQFSQKPGFLHRIASWVADRLHLGAVVSGGLGLYALLVLVGLAAGAIYLAARSGRWAALRQPGSPRAVMVTGHGPALSPEDWRLQARALEAQGRSREALRCWYRALVAELAVRGVIEEVPGRTSGDYERLVRRQVPDVSVEFSAGTALFERSWYGRQAIDQEAFRALQAATTNIARALDQSRRRRSGPSTGTGQPVGGKP